MNNPPNGRPRLYRGWLVVIGAFLASMWATMIHTNFGLFVVPASEELGISRADANTWLIVASLGSALIAPFAGRLIDRFSIPLIMSAGGILMALSLAGIAVTQSLTVMLLLALPLAFASDAAGAMAASTAAARWFRRRRGRALALVGIATSAGGFVIAPLTAYLIVNHGWRGALPILAVLGGGVVVLSAIFLVRSRPTEVQMAQAGELIATPSAEDAGAEGRIWTFRQLLQDRNFIFLAIGIGLLFASDRALLVSVAPYLSDAGIDLQDAAILISVLTGSSILGKLVVGYVADYLDPRRIFVAVAILHLLLLLLFMLQPDFWIMVGFVAILGIGIGGVLPTSQVLTAAIFGSRSFGTVIGTAAVIHQVFMMTLLRAIGEVRDRTGSYTLALQLFFVLVMVATLLIWRLRMPAQTAQSDAASVTPQSVLST